MASAFATSVIATSVAAQEPSAGFMQDPATGITYAKTIQTIERPVVETVVENQEQLVYRPETVTEIKPEVQTVYAPVTEVKWRPYMEGRWNPFRQPTVAYRPVAETYWQRSNQVVNRTTSTTKFVPEKRTVQVARQVPKMKREQVIAYQPVGRVDPTPTRPQITGISEAVAARLQPISAPSAVAAPSTAPMAAPNGMGNATQIASTSMGRTMSDPPRRSITQRGMRANDLRPESSGYAQPLPPSSNSTGIAGLPVLWR
ncbi:hypothetical protein [Stieleria varia]|uniref:hypothetical protein n=1 Tax=Stieleria varia TaxID=2528005 RepID=UPI0011B62DC6|nr:hypothetical protein [Stieleria varia]